MGALMDEWWVDGRVGGGRGEVGLLGEVGKLVG